MGLLPDLGISEWIGDRLGIPRNQQGGSQLFGSRDPIPGGASASWTPSPSPSSNNNNVNTSSAPRSSGNSQYQHGGWYDGKQWDQSQGRFLNPGESLGGGGNNNSGGGGGGNPDQAFLDEINNQYNRTMSYLNQQEGNVRSEYDSSVDLSNQSFNQALEHSQQGYQQNLKALEGNQSELDYQRRSALENAVRARNALEQQRLSRFGGGSSAGMAASELIGQETQRQMGGIEQTYIQEARVLKQSMENLSLSQKQYEDQLNLEKRSVLDGLKKELNSRLSQIQMLRGEAESGKQAARLNVIQQSIERARNIQDYFNQRAMAIRESVYEKQAELSGRYDQLLALADQYDAGEYYVPYQENAFMGTDLSQRVQGQAPRYNFNPNISNDEEENPFFEGGASRSF